MAAVALAGAALATSTRTVALAESLTAVRRITGVPCGATALSTSVAAANVTPATLRLAPRCTYLITGTLGVTGDVGLVGGPSTVIRPAPGFTGRLIDVGSTGRLRVRGLFLQGGSGSLDDDGVGVRNAGTLELNFVTIRGNTANTGNGAGVANLASARALIAHTVISGNHATGAPASGSGVGGGVLNRGSLTLFASRVSANAADDAGGGVDTDSTGTTRIIQSTIDRNVAADTGGGIRNSGSTSLHRTLVEFNRAGTSGGGIFQAGGTIAVRLSIIRLNTPDDCAPANSVAGCVG